MVAWHERSARVCGEQGEIVGHNVVNPAEQGFRPDGVPDGDLIQVGEVAEDNEVMSAQIVTGIDAESEQTSTSDSTKDLSKLSAPFILFPLEVPFEA